MSGNTGGARLAKIKANGATQVWSKQLTLSAGFQLSSPLLVQGSNPASEADDAIYVGTTGFAQVLQNDELNGTSVAGWTVDGGTPDGQAVVLEGAEDVSLTQSGVTLNTSATNRAALGIWVGNTANPGIAINVTVKVEYASLYQQTGAIQKVTNLHEINAYYASGSKDYLYFTTNSASGAGYAFSYAVAQNTTTVPWDTTNLGGNT